MFFFLNAYLNLFITNNGTDSYDFKIFRKPAITNVEIKSNSNMSPNVYASVFKGFLSRVYKICSKRYIDEEIQFLMDVFTQKGKLSLVSLVIKEKLKR